jgi:hypothetical protein
MVDLQGYDELIERFLNHEMTAEEFQAAYDDKYLNNSHSMNEELFKILDWLFAVNDSFTRDPELLKNDSYVNEEQLRESAAKTLHEIRALK